MCPFPIVGGDVIYSISKQINEDVTAVQNRQTSRRMTGLGSSVCSETGTPSNFRSISRRRNDFLFEDLGFSNNNFVDLSSGTYNVVSLRDSFPPFRTITLPSTSKTNHASTYSHIPQDSKSSDITLKFNVSRGLLPPQ
jgi:hypothetical protein